MLRTTSKLAYKSITKTGKAQTQEQHILASMKRGSDYSLRELLNVTSNIEINAMSGRVNTLKRKGLLSEGPHRKCSISDRLIKPVYRV